MPRSFSHCTPRYVFNRIALAVYELRNPAAPWLTKAACNYLDDWLKPHHVGLEWGSGRSTLWFSRRIAGLTSVEHDPVWYAKVQAQLKSLGLTNVEYHLAPLDAKSTGGEPLYVQLGAQTEPGSLDFILVDGRLRDQCVQVAITRLRPGGLLVIDNAEQYIPHASHSPVALGKNGVAPSPVWQSIARTITTWNVTWTSSGVTDTALFIKPPAAAQRVA